MFRPLLCSIILSQRTQAVWEPGVNKQVTQGSNTRARFGKLYTL